MMPWESWNACMPGSQGRRVVAGIACFVVSVVSRLNEHPINADRESVGADNGGGDSGEWWGEKDLCINFKEVALIECASQVLHLSRMLISGQNA